MFSCQIKEKKGTEYTKNTKPIENMDLKQYRQTDGKIVYRIDAQMSLESSLKVSAVYFQWQPRKSPFFHKCISHRTVFVPTRNWDKENQPNGVVCISTVK